MNFGHPFRIWTAVVVLVLSLLPIDLAGECVVSKPLPVHRICGQVLMQGQPLRGTLRLTKRNVKGSAKLFERIEKTDDEGQFDFRDVPTGKYAMRLTPGESTEIREVFVPVFLDLRHPQRKDACMKPIDLKLDLLPEPCVSPELRKMPK